MGQFLIFVLTAALVIVCLFTILVVLMQRPTSSGGLGSALGGGAAELAFGGDTTKVLNKWTVWGSVAFFVLSFILSMTHISSNHDKSSNMTMPAMVEQQTK